MLHHMWLSHSPQQPLQCGRSSSLIPKPDLHPQAVTEGDGGKAAPWNFPGNTDPWKGSWGLGELWGAPIINPPSKDLPSSGRTSVCPPAPHPCPPAPSGGSASSSQSPAPASRGAETPRGEAQPQEDEDGVGLGSTCPMGTDNPQPHITCSR